MRDFYDRSPKLIRPLTQGSIFENAVVTKYNNNVHGLVITARCDMAHDTKVEYVYYLPIVPIEDWYKIDGKQYLLEKDRNRAKEKLMELCEKNHFPFDGIQEEEFALMANNIQDLSQKNQFLQCVNKFYADKKKNVDTYIPNNDKKKELINNVWCDKHMDCMLVEDWNQQGCFRVVLLRDLKRVKLQVALGFSKGIMENDISEKNENDLLYGKDSIYDIVSEIKSPYIELIMQRFANNFCRIGVEDRELSDKSKLTELLFN